MASRCAALFVGILLSCVTLQSECALPTTGQLSCLTTFEIKDTINVFRSTHSGAIAQIGIGLPSPKNAIISQSSHGDVVFTWTNSSHQLSILKDKDLPCEVYETIGTETTASIEDCYTLNSANVYGVGETFPQAWPLSTTTVRGLPFITSDVRTPAAESFVGNIVDRYFLLSDGRAVKIDDDIPLFITVNPELDELCVAAKRSSPYSVLDTENLRLKYRVCYGDNLRDVHSLMQANFIPKPSAIPEESMFRYPIWSTWAEFHRDVDQEKALSFAHEIKNNGFDAVLFELDDRWEDCYGSLKFDSEKFPDPAGMFQEIKSLGFNTSVWVYPFVNTDCYMFDEAQSNGYLVKLIESNNTAGTMNWWDGEGGVVDMTNPDAVAWWTDRLKQLTDQNGLDGYKFDSGEVSYLPKSYVMSGVPSHNIPNIFTTKYVEACSSVTNYAEIRSAYANQETSIFVRLLDRSSTWQGTLGFETVIPAILSIGLIGYPFVLPDMIGGNENADKELMIRWIELNALLPSMQFSVSPWSYDDDVTAIAKKMVDLHSQFAQYIVDLAVNATVTGDPIIRPLWWLDPDDPSAQTVSDQFLVGDDVLVAPILEPRARSRNVVIPSGNWEDKLHGGIIQGPTVLENYSVLLDELAYFVRASDAQII